ncbi:AraC family transcriptional regulator [Luteimonas sp. S4-F44]|uniref:helix-turn-helix transcriptional regulator n=1 Tax=Luteimonas sp. S4-F44 TaxID=2925842 RepID=UPI001F536244|nr:AraC family transcriptional regulator [Luteimonas sp. S4-F44]UNK41227.1 AraC family transcriptional regulator [Luteimonas sp. S4-F44]
MAQPAPPLPIAIRSYGANSQVDRHDFAQLVLPLDGWLHMDIAGAGARLDRNLGAFVEVGARHDQISDAANRSIILDLHAGELDPRIADCLARRPYVALTAEARSLIDYMEALTLRSGVSAHRLRLWLPLLLDTLLGAPAPSQARLAPLLAKIEAQPARGWTAETMAAQVGVSASRLHALFQQELGTTPRAWLSALRLARARDLLVRTALPIAEIAYCCGYADQSALTRAMRRADDQTPAQLRRQTRG